MLQDTNAAIYDVAERWCHAVLFSENVLILNITT